MNPVHKLRDILLCDKDIVKFLRGNDVYEDVDEALDELQIFVDETIEALEFYSKPQTHRSYLAAQILEEFNKMIGPTTEKQPVDSVPAR